MTGRELIKRIMVKVGMTNAEYAHKFGLKPNQMWERVNGKKQRDIPLTTMTGMIKVLGYKLVAVPEGYECPPDGFDVDVVRAEKCYPKAGEV